MDDSNSNSQQQYKGPVHESSLVVTRPDIDIFNHVNNEVYVRWLMQVATEHSNKVGYDLNRYVEEGAAFVVRRHEIDYLLPALLNDQLKIETWVDDISRTTSKRKYRITRAIDQKTILEAQTVWAYVSLKTGRPISIPQAIRDAFHV